MSSTYQFFLKAETSNKWTKRDWRSTRHELLGVMGFFSMIVFKEGIKASPVSNPAVFSLILMDLSFDH